MSSKKDIAYDYLKEAILSNELKPGTPISEIAVAKELNISRTPLREAMRELEREGLIISYPDRGSFVSQVSPSDIDEIYELRSLIESWCLRQGIDRIDKNALNVVRSEFQVAYDSNDWQLFHEADRKLHGMIVDSAASPRIRSFMDILNAQSERVRRISARGISRSEKSLKEHTAIIDAIMAGDVEKAQQEIRKHLSSVGDTAIEVSRRAF